MASPLVTGRAGRPGLLVPGLLVKLRPSRPWRIGPASGARERVDLIYHSDTLYSAITNAMRLLGRLEYWLEVTARREHAPLVRFSSMFPFYGDTLYVTPPRHIWPPAPSVRVHYAGARFVPVSLVESIFAGKPIQDDRYTVDGESQCLLQGARTGPFRISVRSSAAVDRLSGATAPHRTACLEFVPKAGLWFAISFADEITRDQWQAPLRSAIRLLADSGFGGERSRGWGRAHTPEFRDGFLPHLIYKGLPAAESVHWTLSLTTPAASDEVEWDRGSYSTTVRGGRIESPSASGAAKKLLTMIEEGSVLLAKTLEGSAPDVAPEGFAHPVYHAGWAFSIAVPAELPRQPEEAVPQPSEVAPAETAPAEATPMTVAEQAAASEELSAPDDVADVIDDVSHVEGDEPTAFEASESLNESFGVESLEDNASIETADSEDDESDLEIPTTDDELEQLENEDVGGPNDDITPPMNDPGPMEPPFTEPEDLTPINPETDPEPEEGVPGPNPDEPEKPEGPIE